MSHRADEAGSGWLLLLALLPGLFLCDLLYGALRLADTDPALTPGQVVRGGLL